MTYAPVSVHRHACPVDSLPAHAGLLAREAAVLLRTFSWEQALLHTVGLTSE